MSMTMVRYKASPGGDQDLDDDELSLKLGTELADLTVKTDGIERQIASQPERTV